MRITEIDSTTPVDGWEKLSPTEIPPSLLDQISGVWGTRGIWVLDRSKVNAPLMVVDTDVSSYNPIINDKRFSPHYVAAKLTDLVQSVGHLNFGSKSGYVRHNNKILPFFDVFKFTNIAPSDNGKFWYELPSDPLFGPPKQWSSGLKTHTTLDYNKSYASLPASAFESAGAMVDQITYHAPKVFTKGSSIIELTGIETVHGLQNLVDAVGIVDGYPPNQNLIIKDGKVENWLTSIFSEPDGTLSDGTKIFKVPAHVLPAISNIIFEKTWKSADSALLAILPGKEKRAAEAILVAIRKGTILGMARGHQVNATETDLSDLAALLSAEKNIGAAKAKFIKPESKLHKVIRYVNDHPGCNRSDLYRVGLNITPNDAPGINSPKAFDGLAARLKLITLREAGDLPSRYNMRITPTGALVLRRLDGGRDYPLQVLIDTSKKLE